MTDTNPPSWAVVIPTNRTIDARYLAAIPEHVPIYVVLDSDKEIKSTRPNVHAFSLTEQRRIMGSNYDLIPRRTAACRNFAYYIIWKETDHSHIVTLDDDCKTYAGFLDQHGVVGTTAARTTLTADSGWLNTVALLPVRRRLFSRGYPYFERGQGVAYQSETTVSRCVCNLGLWDTHLDFDGMDKFLFEEYQETYLFERIHVSALRVGTPAKPTRIPFSGMNVAFAREVLPVATQFPMNQQTAPGYSLWRFDDLWCGGVLQTLIDKRNHALTVGPPIVSHLRGGSLKREVAGEHFGHLISPYYYEMLDDIRSEVRPASYAVMYLELCTRASEWIAHHKKRRNFPPLYADVLGPIFDHLTRWIQLFQ